MALAFLGPLSAPLGQDTWVFALIIMHSGMAVPRDRYHACRTEEKDLVGGICESII